MEFGALLCRPKSPECMFCSLNRSCVAFQQNKIKDLPVKLKKLKRKKRYFNYLVVESPDKEFILQQRLKKDIWQKLFEFPLIEAQGKLGKKDIRNTELFKTLGLDEDITIRKINKKTYKHVLTHQDIFADFWSLKCSKGFDKNKLKNYSVVDSNSIRTFAVPILIDRFLNKLLLHLPINK
jgi:A/G-specific adenine glycosylase